MSENSFTTSISLDGIISKAKQNLSILGKRRVDSKGATLFTGVTLSSAEEDLLNQFIKRGSEIFLGEFASIVDSTYEEENKIEVSFKTTRVSDGKVEAFEKNFESFVLEYTIYEALSLSYTEDERKNREVELQRHLQAAVKQIYSKDSPSIGDKQVNSMNGEVILDNKPVVLN